MFFYQNKINKKDSLTLVCQTVDEGKQLPLENGAAMALYEKEPGELVLASGEYVNWIFTPSEPPTPDDWKFKFTAKETAGFYSIAATDLFIDWGDGTTNEYEDGNHRDISHTYSDQNTHQVKLKGNITSMNFLNQVGLISVDMIFPEEMQAETSAVSKFNGCTNLVSVPDHLFLNCPNIISYQQVFKECSSLESLPSHLFEYDSEYGIFHSAFKNCSALTSIPSDIFDYTNPKEVSNAFDGCSGVTSNVPELWDSEKYPTISNHLSTFAGCVNAANYNDIPNDWK